MQSVFIRLPISCALDIVNELADNSITAAVEPAHSAGIVFLHVKDEAGAVEFLKREVAKLPIKYKWYGRGTL